MDKICIQFFATYSTSHVQKQIFPIAIVFRSIYRIELLHSLFILYNSQFFRSVSFLSSVHVYLDELLNGFCLKNPLYNPFYCPKMKSTARKMHRKCMEYFAISFANSLKIQMIKTVKRVACETSTPVAFLFWAIDSDFYTCHCHRVVYHFWWCSLHNNTFYCALWPQVFPSAFHFHLLLLLPCCYCGGGCCCAVQCINSCFRCERQKKTTTFAKRQWSRDYTLTETSAGLNVMKLSWQLLNPSPNHSHLNTS